MRQTTGTHASLSSGRRTTPSGVRVEYLPQTPSRRRKALRAAKNARRWLMAVMLVLFAIVIATHRHANEVVSLGEEVHQPSTPSLAIDRPVIPGINGRIGPERQRERQKK